MRKFVIITLVVVVCLSLVSMAQAKVAVVAAFVAEDNSSSRLVVFDVDIDPDNFSDVNITEMYSTAPVAGYVFKSLAVGTFSVDPISSQVMVAIYDPANDESFLRNYTLHTAGETFKFDTSKVAKYEAVDVIAAQFDDDALDEYATAYDVIDNVSGGVVRVGDNTGELYESTLNVDRYYTGLAAGQYDNDTYEEIAVSSWEVDNGTGQLIIYQHNLGGGSQLDPIHEAVGIGKHPFTDVATGDYTLDGLSETYLCADERGYYHDGNPDPYPQGPKVYSQQFMYLQPPDNGSDWEHHQTLRKWDNSSYSVDEALLKVVTLNIDDDPECENVHINQQENSEYAPGIYFESTELRVQDDNWAGLYDGMVMNNWDTSAGQVSDILCRYTSLDGGDLNGDGYDDMVVGHVSKGFNKFDNDSDLLETGIRIFQWDPTKETTAQYPLGQYVYRYGNASDMTLINGRIVDVKIIDLDDAPALDPTTCTEVWSMGYGMQTDLDKTCKIDWGDFSVFASHWLAIDCGNPADFDNSCCSGGKVDWGDFSIFASTWLDCNDPENMPPCIPNWP